MIVPREQTQVINYSTLPAEQDQTIERLRIALMGAGQVVAQGLNVAAEQKRFDTQRKEAIARLDDNKSRLAQGTELQQIENALGRERMRTKAISELHQLTEADRRKLEENVKNGALAEVWRAPADQLPKTAADLGIESSENLTEIDRALGERRAMIDYGQLQHQFLLDTSKTPNQHLDQWLADHQQPSDEQQAAYSRSLTRWVLQDDETARREMIAAGKKVGFENAVFSLERQAAIDRRKWMSEPAAMEAALKDFHAQAVKFSPAVSTLDVSNLFAQRVLPILLEGMSGKEQLGYLDALFKGGKSPYLSALSGNKEARTALVEDATRLYQREQADRARELGETLSSAKSMIEYTQAVGAIAVARKGLDINEAQWQDLSQKIDNKTREIRSRVKIEGKLDGDPRFAAEAISGGEQQLFSDELRRRQVQFESKTGQPMGFDQQIKLELGSGDLSNETKERIRNLVEAPAMKRPDGTLDTTNIEQGIAALQTVKESSPLYYQQRYIDNKEALTPHVELAVSLLDGGYPRQQVVTWIAQIDKTELGKAQSALAGPGAVDLAGYLKDKSGTNFLLFRNVGFEFDDAGASKRAVRLAQSLFKAYYATSIGLDEDHRRTEARSLAAAEVFSRYDRAKVNGTRYFIERAALPFSKDVLTENFGPVADNLGWMLSSRGFLKSSGDLGFDFDNAAVSGKVWNVPVTIKGRPTQLVFAFPLDAEKQVEFRRKAWNKSIDIAEEWFKASNFKATLPQRTTPASLEEAMEAMSRGGTIGPRPGGPSTRGDY